MMKRRWVMQAGLASVAGLATAPVIRAQDRFNQASLLDVDPFGTLTLCFVSDLFGQTDPIYLRPPDGPVLADEGVPVSEGFRVRYGVGGQTPMGYAYTADDFETLAGYYGPLGGLDRMATALAHIRRTRPDTIVVAAGQTLRGSDHARDTGGRSVLNLLGALGVEVLSDTGGLQDAGDLPEHAQENGISFIHNALLKEVNASNQGGPDLRIIDRGPHRIAVMALSSPGGAGDAAPRCIAAAKAAVAQARDQAAPMVVCLSDLGLAADRALAQEVEGIDVILSGRSQLCTPEPVPVGSTRILCAGGQGCFLARLDVSFAEGRVSETRLQLIPLFADLIASDREMRHRIALQLRQVQSRRASRVGEAGGLLYRRAALGGTWDDVICDAMMAQLEAQIAIAPGMRHGPTLLPGTPITRADIAAVVAWPGGDVHVAEMTGAQIQRTLDREAERFSHPDVFRRSGLDMVRLGGLQGALDLRSGGTAQVSDLRMVSTGVPLAPDQSYRVAVWDGQSHDGAVPIAELLEQHIKLQGRVSGRAGPAWRLMT